MPRITILMPVYNGEKFLEETINSVLKQTYTNFTFLIINDGSTDRSEEIIQSYNDKRILYIKNPDNLGLVETLNKGIEMINTEFMARMDADDLWVETKLEKQLEVFDSRREIDLCGTSIRKFGTNEGDYYFPVNNAGLKVGFIFFCCMSHPSVVFRMSFLKETGLRYKANYFPAEDYKMWSDCLKYTQIYNIPEKLVFYRQHDKQITQNSNSDQAVLTNKVKWEVIEELSDSFSAEEKNFHLNTYVKSDINSVNDYKKFVKWSNKLVRLNKKRRFIFDKKILKRILNKHNQASYLEYVKRKYFHGTHRISILRYTLSFNWIHLNVRHNLKLLLRKQ